MLTESGVDPSSAASYVASEYGVQPTQDAINGLQSLPTTGSEAGDVTGELVDGAADSGILAGGEASLGEALSGTCAATAGLACAAGAGIALGGAIDYVLGVLPDDGGDQAEQQPQSTAIAQNQGWGNLLASKRVFIEPHPSDCANSAAWGVFGDAYSIDENGQGGTSHSVYPQPDALPYDNGAGEGLAPILAFSCTAYPAGAFILMQEYSSFESAGGVVSFAPSNSGTRSTPGWTDVGVYNSPGDTACTNDVEGPAWPGGYDLGDSHLGSGNGQTVFQIGAGDLSQHGWTGFVDQFSNNFSCNLPDWITTSAEAPSSVQLSSPLTSCPADDTCAPVADNPSSDWNLGPQQLATVLSSPHSSDLNQYFTSVAGGTSSNGNPVSPPGLYAIPSSCAAGGNPTTCESALGAEGFTYQTSIVTDAEAVDSDGAGNIVEAQPSAGQKVDLSTVVEVDVNPSPLPFALPAPNTDESYSSYVARLQALGYVGKLTEQTSDSSDDSAGSYYVTSTSPAAGTLVSPGTAVTINTDPTSGTSPASGTDPGDGTDPSSGTGGATAPTTPTLPGITIPSAPTPCNVFPFGLPCWISNQLGGFSAPAVAPSVKIAIPQIFGGGSTDIDLGATIFGVQLDSLMQYVRPVLLISAAIGLMVWLAGMAMGGSTGGGSGGEEE